MTPLIHRGEPFKAGEGPAQWKVCHSALSGLDEFYAMGPAESRSELTRDVLAEAVVCLDEQVPLRECLHLGGLEQFEFTALAVRDQESRTPLSKVQQLLSVTALRHSNATLQPVMGDDLGEHRPCFGIDFERDDGWGGLRETEREPDRVIPFGSADIDDQTVRSARDSFDRLVELPLVGPEKFRKERRSPRSLRRIPQAPEGAVEDRRLRTQCVADVPLRAPDCLCAFGVDAHEKPTGEGEQ